MKSVMSLEMYKKLKLNNLKSTSIPHVVGASGESLGARGKTKCEININSKIFYQTFIVCEHLKRPIILGRDFSIQNCIGISWTKTNTRRLTQKNEVIAETAEYQTPSRASVSLKMKHQSPAPILHSSRCRYQHYRKNQSGSHPRPVMAKCKSQQMHIPHDSRSEGKRTKCGNTICYCELQSS